MTGTVKPMAYPGRLNTKHLYNICTMLDQRRRRWADVVQMFYKSFVFVGIDPRHKKFTAAGLILPIWPTIYDA